jgi:NadR type nicotinamide-nucleotide adenylyltransferase
VNAPALSRLRRIVITGPEAVGKTTLAAALASHFDVPWAAEYARAYAEAARRPLTIEDIEAIARGQLEGETAAEHAALDLGAQFVVLDTDLVSTVVYAKHYYGTSPEWVVRAASERRGDLYLLLEPDLPWVPDSVRDRPENRHAMHRNFRTWLHRFDARVAGIRGTGPERLTHALRAIREGLPDID